MTTRPKDARRFLRAPVTLEVRYRTVGSFLVSYSQNLSKGGLFLETSEQLPAGTELMVRFEISQIDRPIETQAKVVWIRKKATTEGPPGLGIAFDQLEEHIGDQIDQVVRTFAGVTFVVAAADAEAVERLARNLFSVMVCSVVRATSTSAAIALLRPEVDLVLVDLDSLGSEGLSLVEAARDCAPSIPLVAVIRDDRWRAEAQTAGASTVLAHPVRYRDLRQQIVALIGKPIR